MTLRNYGLQKTLREVAASSHKKRYRHFLYQQIARSFDFLGPSSIRQ
ncbi:hypothetical protein VCR4J2_250142 [Vibrio coralliirubri]|nr:hypothetical protein VCR4J2_250142 [Vibrio coralliirubri]